MQNRFPRWILFLLIALFLAGCDLPGGGTSPAAGKKTIVVAGSTSIMPFAEKLAEYYMLAHPNLSIDVQGGGSSAGIQACLNRTVDIGMSSRELKDKEKVLSQTVICYDAIAVVVHPTNTSAALTQEQIKGIYSGRIRSWKELGWVDRAIDMVTREEGSGTRSAFEDLMMRGVEISESTMVQDSNGSVKEVIATDPYAIGYISLGVVDEKVKRLPIDGVAATVENIKAKRYRIVRPFLYLTLGSPGPEAKSFIDFVVSREGQNVLKKEGFVPVNE